MDLPTRKPDGKIRFGLNASTQMTTWPEFRTLCVEAEAMGYDSFWLWDHFIPGRDSGPGHSLECFTTMSALAVATSRITLGTLVLGVMYRNPALTAKMAAMVDHISGGRLFLGMGAAWYKEEHEGLGIDFPSPGERVRRENESLELIRRLWTEDFVDHQGRYYWTKAGQIDPKPTQTPYPPILVGARGDNGLKVTARHADAHNTARDVEGIGEIHGRLRAACEAVGRDYDSIEKTAIALQAVSPTAEGVEAKKKGLEGMFSAPFASMQNRVLHGAVEEVVEQVQRYVDAGITHFMFSQFAPYDLDGLKLMAEKVIPRFR